MITLQKPSRKYRDLSPPKNEQKIKKSERGAEVGVGAECKHHKFSFISGFEIEKKSYVHHPAICLDLEKESETVFCLCLDLENAVGLYFESATDDAVGSSLEMEIYVCDHDCDFENEKESENENENDDESEMATLIYETTLTESRAQPPCC